MTRNPYGFFNKKDKDKKYMGVKLSKLGKIDDNQFQKAVIDTLDKNHILVQHSSTKIENNLALPDTFKGFNMRFIDPITKNLTNKLRFSRRILGLTSYFRSAQEELMPAFNIEEDFRVVDCSMSDYQFGLYEEARKNERVLEKRNAQKRKKP